MRLFFLLPSINNNVVLCIYPAASEYRLEAAGLHRSLAASMKLLC
jgi:hypothetical protein